MNTCYLVEGGKANRNQYSFEISFIDDDEVIITVFNENTMKSASLVEAYRAVAETDFDTTDEITEAQEELEDQFADIFNETNLSDDSDLGLTEEAQIAMNDLRDVMQTFLENEKLTTAQIVSVKTPTIPLQILVFEYYGSTDNVNIIIEQNKIRNPSFVSGELNILSD